MPSYDYHCPANGRTVEVRHRMSETVDSWGEVCQRAAIEPGDTPPDSPVHRLISGGAVITGTARGPAGRAAPSGGCCGNGGCACQ